MGWDFINDIFDLLEEITERSVDIGIKVITTPLKIPEKLIKEIEDAFND